MKLELADYAATEANLLAKFQASAPADGLEQRSEMVNALALELRQPGAVDAKIQRALGRFRAAVHRQSGGTMQIVPTNIVAHVMVVAAQMWAKTLLEHENEILRQGLASDSDPPDRQA